MKSDPLSFELQLQFPAVRAEETLDGDNRNVLPQIAPEEMAVEVLSAIALLLYRETAPISTVDQRL